MWWLLSSHQRKEAASRAPDYARYYKRRYGGEAAQRLRQKIASSRSRYYRMLYKLALAELARTP